MGLFRRGATADDALADLATTRGWPAVVLSAERMLPPSHADADVHDLGSRGAPACAGRSFAAPIGTGARPGVVSYLELARNDVDLRLYECVQWEVPEGGAARFEIEAPGSLWNHHRLGDRFAPAGRRPVPSVDGVDLHVGLSVDEPFTRALAAHPRLAVLAAQGGGLRNGLAGEQVGRRAAVFTWLGRRPRGEPERWVALLAAADALADAIDAAGDARRTT